LPPPLSQYLKTAPHISRVVLCLDNDAPGRKAAAVLKELLRGYEVIDRPPVRGKDYNDLLRYRRDAQRGEAR
jgi:DNA primase